MKTGFLNPIVVLIIYALTVAVLSIYHALNFTDYVHFKGNETMYYTFALLLTSILFQVYVFAVYKKTGWG